MNTPGSSLPVSADDAPLEQQIARIAAVACEAAGVDRVHVWAVTADGERLRHIVAHGLSERDAASLTDAFELPLAAAGVLGWVHQDGEAAVVQVSAPLPARLGDAYAGIAALRTRAFIAMPIAAHGHALGVLFADNKYSRRDLPDGAQAMLSVFASHIAAVVDNVRLADEADSLRATVQSVQRQQNVSSEILRLISQSRSDVQPVLDSIAERARLLSGASQVGLTLFDGKLIDIVAFANVDPAGAVALRAAFPRPPGKDNATTQSILESRPVAVPDVTQWPGYTLTQAATAVRFRSALAVPILKDGKAIGALTMMRPEVGDFAASEVAMLESFAAQALIAIENTRQFHELQARNRDLGESLEQQTATSEILRIISRSQSDVQPVFEAIAVNARKLCGATSGAVFSFDGELIHIAAVESVTQAGVEAARREFPMPPGRRGATARCIAERAVVYVKDVREDPEYQLHRMADAVGFRCALVVPMLVDGKPIGAINVTGDRPAMFSERQITMLQTFAAQAVIAIQNAQMFNETKEALERQRVSAEILRVISSSVEDTQPVFDAIAKACESLFKGQYVGINLIDERGGLDLAASAYPPGHASIMAEVTEHFRTAPTRTGTRVALRGQVVDFPDIDATGVPAEVRDGCRVSDARAITFAPMVAGGKGIGSIWVARVAALPMPEKDQALLKSFADQAVIAIENARLFNETREALERQTAMSELLKLISESPTTERPVFDAIAARARILCDAEVSATTRFDGEQLHLIGYHGTSPEAERAMRNSFPRPPDEGSINGRCILARAPVQIPDTELDPVYGLQDAAKSADLRSLLAVPILRGNEILGVVGVGRKAPGPFAPQLIALLQTFADHAVIAIENTRLFNELQVRNKDLTESLEQQTATSEILRVISSSPAQLQPVLDALVESAARLCQASDAVIHRIDMDSLRQAAHYGSIPGLSAEERIPIRRDFITGRAIVDRTVIHLRDVLAEPDAEFAGAKSLAVRDGYRTILVAPLLREGAPLGVILIRRTEVRPFSDKQIELLQTFADQAVIAIENTRLFNELEARNSDLTESLEQQIATSEILRVISQSQRDVQPVFETIAANARMLCGANDAGVYGFDGTLIHLKAVDSTSAQAAEAIRRMYPRPPTPGSTTAAALAEGKPCYVRDVRDDPDYPLQSHAQDVGYVSGLSVPMLRDGQIYGAITITSPEADKFSERQIAMLQTFADQAVIAIENTRLFNELEVRNKDLTESLEQQTATSEILRVISQSQRDVQPVFEAIVQNARRLCDAAFGGLHPYDGEMIHLAAAEGYAPEALAAIERTYPIKPVMNSATGRAVLTRSVCHMPDVMSDPEYALRGMARDAGYRSTVAVPMLKDGLPIGTISLTHTEANAFAPRQIAMLQTFADQAVIAIENTRLFNELERRNKDLTEALEQQTATSEILRVMSRTQDDAGPVFQTIARNARILCSGNTGGVYTFDGEWIHVAALDGVRDAGVEDIHRVYPMRPGRYSAGGRAILTGELVHIPDVHAEPGYSLQSNAATVGFRSVVAVPMLREGNPIGLIIVTGADVAMFSASQTAMLQTFADQAVIAVENARLFGELQTRNRDLTESLEQQTATSEILRVISQSQRDVQPVFQAIVDSALRLCSAGSGAGSLLILDGDVLRVGGLAAPKPEAHEAMHKRYPRRITDLGEDSPALAALSERAPVYHPDVPNGNLSPAQKQLAAAVGYRSAVFVPMLKERDVIGLVIVTGPETNMFSPRQIAMLQTFADQAVIAIENTRLFNELEARNTDLTESLEQQTATSEILRVISESQRDVQPVFEAIAANARNLCGARDAAVYALDGTMIHLKSLVSG